jgi:hypothetical protein
MKEGECGQEQGARRGVLSPGSARGTQGGEGKRVGGVVERTPGRRSRCCSARPSVRRPDDGRARRRWNTIGAYSITRTRRIARGADPHLGRRRWASLLTTLLRRASSPLAPLERWMLPGSLLRLPAAGDPAGSERTNRQLRRSLGDYAQQVGSRRWRRKASWGALAVSCGWTSRRRSRPRGGGPRASSCSPRTRAFYLKDGLGVRRAISSHRAVWRQREPAAANRPRRSRRPH